ncbi:MAG: hypothetical protein ACKVU4_12690 [Phycisphaerales bacterium]
MRHVRISDDRGRRVALCRVRDLGPEVDPGVRAAVGGSNLRLWHCVPSLVTVALVVLGVRACRRMRGGGSGTPPATDVLAQLAAIVIALGILAGLGWLWASWRGAKAARRAYLAGSVCPSCGYSLAGLPAEGDGCTVCPECSGAWRVAVTATAG